MLRSPAAQIAERRTDTIMSGSTIAWEKKVKESLNVATFLGAITLGALTFIVQLKIPFGDLTFLSFTISPPSVYKELLIFFTGAASALLITSVFGLKTILVHKVLVCLRT